MVRNIIFELLLPSGLIFCSSFEKGSKELKEYSSFLLSIL